MFDLGGKTALVAGAMGLIGSEITRSLRKQEAFTLSLDIKEGADFKVDFSKREEVKQFFDNMESCDVFVNATYPAGVVKHLKSFYYGSLVAAEHMKKSGGVIINLSSIYGIVGSNPSLYRDTDMAMPAGYSYNKAGVVGLTRWIATNYGKYGVRANCVCPGGVWDNQPIKFIDRYCERVSLGRMAKPIDIAQAVIGLIGMDYITGVALPVDGGYTAW